MIFTFFYYTFICSAVLFYGIGLNRATLVTGVRDIAGLLVKILLTVFSTSVLTWLFICYILNPLGLIELYPLIALLIFLVISIFFETIIRITSGKSLSEFSISYLIVILTLNESTSIFDVLLINACCVLSFVLVIPVLKVIKRKNSYIGNISIHANSRTLMLISIALLIMSMAVFNVSWLTPGVIK